MRLFLILALAILALIAGENYTQGKIDMHGGNHNNYNTNGSFGKGGFRSSLMDMSKLVDKNATKK
jgi:hypothetical protein